MQRERELLQCREREFVHRSERENLFTAARERICFLGGPKGRLLRLLLSRERNCLNSVLVVSKVKGVVVASCGERILFCLSDEYEYTSLLETFSRFSVKCAFVVSAGGRPSPPPCIPPSTRVNTRTSKHFHEDTEKVLPL